MRGWILALSISVALHAAVAAAAGLVLRGEPPLPPLIIDLSAIIAGRDEEAASREPAAEPKRVAPRPEPQERTGRSSPAREPIAPSGPAAASREPAALTPPTVEAPSPVAPLPAAPTPAAREEPLPREAPPIARPTTPEAPSSIAQATPGADPRAAERGDTGGRPASSVDSAGSPGGVQPGDKAAVGRGERVASLGVPGGGGSGSDYDAYYARLRQRLGEVLRSRYPSAARQLELRGTVHLEIDVEPSGAIGAVTVITSSSHEILDRAAVDAVRSLSRVPFPSNVRPRALKVRLPVVFEVQ